MKLLAALSCVASLVASPAQDAGGHVALGDVPAYKFRAPILRGTGESRLSDFHGRPVLVQFWSHKLWGSVDDMMKLMLQLQLEYEDDLQVLLVDWRLEPAALERLLLEKGWLATSAMWTTERPFVHESEQDPCCVLLSCEGKVIFKSPALGKSVDHTELVYSTRLMDEIDAAVAAEVDRRHGILADSSAPVRKACDDFAAGKLARALASVRSLAATDASAAHALAAFERQIGERLGRTEFLLAKGRIEEAEEHLAPLQVGMALGDESAQRLSNLRQSLASTELDAERKADRALAKLEQSIFEEGNTDRTPGTLRALAKRHEGTRRGAEAARLAALLEPD